MRVIAAIMLCAVAIAQQSITLPREAVDPRAQGAAPAQAPEAQPAPSAPAQPAPAAPATSVPASPLPGLGGGMPGPAPQSNDVPIVVVALKASTEGHGAPVFDDELKPFQKILETLKPYDTFDIIAQEKKPAPMSRETRFTVNGIYTAYVQPLRTVEAPEGGQRFDLQMRVEMLSGSDYIDAIRARGEAAPKQAMLLRGMDLDVGELIVMVMVAPEGDQSDSRGGQQQDQQDQQQEQQDQQQQQQQGEQDEEKEKQEQQEQEEQEERELSNTQGDEQKEPEEQKEGEQKEDEARALQEEQEKPEGEQEQQQSAQQDGKPEDMETIEAILQNLEEKDRQEQKNARYRRSQVIIRGDWW